MDIPIIRMFVFHAIILKNMVFFPVVHGMISLKLLKRVIVFSSSSAIFSMMNEEYNVPYDVFNNGNFGMINPLFYVEEACANANTVIVIPENYGEENWQNPDGVFEYVDEHMNPVQRYGVYIWYEHP